MSTLTDRYVWAVIRSLPEKQRNDIERELRASIDDAMEARVAAGEPIRTAEHDTLLELGDPDRLSASYAERPSFLIGPAYYFDYIRLLKLLYVLVLPITAATVFLVQLLTGAGIGAIVGSVIGTAIEVAVHLGFWTTLVFAIITRSEKARKPVASWSLESLPERTSPRVGIPELVASVVFLLFFAGAIVWQQYNSVFTDASGSPIPVLQPDLWTLWIPYVFGLIALELVFAIVLYRTGWNWPLALVNVVLNVAFLVPAIWLVVNDRVLNHAFLSKLGWPDDLGMSVIAPILVLVFVGVAAGDVIDGMVKARRGAVARR
ncbi:MAG: hypothetical protein JWR04_3292 [Rhodoglobus sp.]|nr:hypothetical protein [Rhodoglobus sp.]